MKRTFARERSTQTPTRAILSKLSRLALLYAAEESEQLPIVRLYRDRILSGEVTPPAASALAEERWVLQLGFRRLDEAWMDAEIYRLTLRATPLTTRP